MFASRLNVWMYELYIVALTESGSVSSAMDLQVYNVESFSGRVETLN